MQLVTCLRILCTAPRRTASLQVQYTCSRCQHFQVEPVSAGRGSLRKTSRNCGASSLPMLPPVRYVASWKSNGEKVETLQDVARLILDGQCRQIVVMAGAGISTPSGIPDFRSAGSGLYDSLRPLGLPYPEAVFDIQYFAHDPKPFFAVARRLCPGSCRPNYTHYFARLLHDKGLLLRLYTQNIDGLERRAGIPPERLVEAHGTFATATCTACRQRYDWDQLRDDVLQGRVPLCHHCAGVVKPDIVFFGEQLPLNFYRHLIDFPLADLLIILGTSLEVQPFASLSELVRRSVPRLLINQDAVGSLCRDPTRSSDVAELGDVVRGVKRFTDLLGWSGEVSQLLSREHRKLENVGEPPSH